MLKEFKNIKQNANSFRRLFNDADFDLYLWFNSSDDKNLVGFQIVYSAENSQHAITWKSGIGISYATVDCGEIGINRTPILISKRKIASVDSLKKIKDRLEAVELELRDILIEKINDIMAQNLL